MISYKELEDAKKKILELRSNLLERSLTIKTETLSGKAEVRQAMYEARILGLLAIEMIEKFELAVDTHRIVCICKEDLDNGQQKS